MNGLFWAGRIKNSNDPLPRANQPTPDFLSKSLTDVFPPIIHQGEDSADKPETSANVNSKPPKSDAEQTVELLAKIVDEVKLDQRLPNQGKSESSNGLMGSIG